jgi:hypothetical protein
VLEKTYSTRRNDSAALVLSNHIGLPSAHLLALWFGADELRTPEDRTISIIRTAICSTNNDDKSQNLEQFAQTCKAGLERWANRLRLDLGRRFNTRNIATARVKARACCVWASKSTASGLSKDQRPLAKLRPSDFQLSRNSERGKIPQRPATMGTTLKGKHRTADDKESKGEAAVTADDNMGSDRSSPVGELEDIHGYNPPRGSEASIVVATATSSTNHVSQLCVSKGPAVTPDPVSAEDDNVDGMLGQDSPSFRGARPPAATIAMASPRRHRELSADPETDASAAAQRAMLPPEEKEPGNPLTTTATTPSLESALKRPAMPVTPAEDTYATHGLGRASVATLPSTMLGQPRGQAVCVGTPETTATRTSSEASSQAWSVFDDESAESRRDSLQTQFTEMDASPMTSTRPPIDKPAASTAPTTLKRQSGPADNDSAAPPRKKPRVPDQWVNEGQQEQQRQQPENSAGIQDGSGDGQHKDKASSPQGSATHLPDMREVMMGRLKDETGWLGGETVDHFVQLAAFSSRSSSTITSLMLQSVRAKDADSFAQRFVDVETANPVDKVLLGVNIGDGHWVAAHLDVCEWTITVYDSLKPKPGKAGEKRMKNVSDSVNKILSVLEPILRRSDLARVPDHHPEIVFAAKPAVQQDSHNCGVFTIVNAFYHATGLTPPGKIDGSNWRSLLLAMATHSPITSTVGCLTPTDPLTQANRLRRRVDDEVPLRFDTMSQYVACTSRRSTMARTLWYGICRDAETSIDLAMRWLQNDVVHVLAPLEQAASSEVARLKALLKSMDAAAEKMRLAVSTATMSLTLLAQIYTSALETAERQADKLQRMLRMRLDSAEACVRAIQALDLPGAMQSLVTAAELNRTETEEARKAMELPAGAAEPQDQASEGAVAAGT